MGVRLLPRNPFNDMHHSGPETTFNFVTEQFNQFKLAYLHIYEMGIGDYFTAPKFDIEKLCKISKGIYMVIGGCELDRGDAAIGSDDADLASFGAKYLANTVLVKRFADNAALNEPGYATLLWRNC